MHVKLIAKHKWTRLVNMGYTLAKVIVRGSIDRLLGVQVIVLMNVQAMQNSIHTLSLKQNSSFFFSVATFYNIVLKVKRL